MVIFHSFPIEIVIFPVKNGDFPSFSIVFCMFTRPGNHNTHPFGNASNGADQDARDIDGETPLSPKAAQRSGNYRLAMVSLV